MRRHFLAVVVALVVGAAAGRALAEPQPLMEDALGALNSAIGSLERAQHDKGGHRAKALELTRQAREEVKAGIGFANSH